MPGAQELHLPQVRTESDKYLNTFYFNKTKLFISILTPRCGETGDKAHTVSYCPKKLRRVSSGGRRVSESQDEEPEDPRIPTPMVGHLINRISLANAEREQ